MLAQRERLLAEVHMTADELRERAEALSARQLDVWHTVEGIHYLLGRPERGRTVT
ncbi:hypothetical protein [Streptomyces sp. NPDC058373]|uniref:hypothetical protein n=1 Tax=Streptomyces sp. NPDC058373 TaxID=3346465 RepID=UPI0036539EA0